MERLNFMVEARMATHEWENLYQLMVVYFLIVIVSFSCFKLYLGGFTFETDVGVVGSDLQVELEQ